MGRPRTGRSTIKIDPLDALLPVPGDPAGPTVRRRGPRPRRAAPEPGAAANADEAAPAAGPPRAPAPGPGVRQKLTMHLDAELVNRVKNAAYWNPRLTIARIAERGLRWAIEQVERENGGPYPQRESDLTGGRPIK